MAIPTASPSLVKELIAGAGASTTYFIFWASGTPSWCPDCRQSLPAVEKVFGVKDAPANYFVLAERGAWRDPHHFARQQYDVQCVPSILAFKQGKEVGRIVDVPACAQEGLIRKFVKDTM